MGMVHPGEDVPLHSPVEAVCAPQILSSGTEALIPHLPGIGSPHSARFHVGTGGSASFPKSCSLPGAAASNHCWPGGTNPP